MAFFGGFDAIAVGVREPTFCAGRRAASADATLGALARRAIQLGDRAFTAEDLRRSCAAFADAQLPADVRRRLHRAINDRRSGRAIAGLTVLLALCGWISGGDEGARLAVAGALTPGGAGGGAGTRAALRQRRDARRLHAGEALELFAVVHEICRRAGMRRVPDIYVLAGERAMNAYALGTADDAVITLTSGLLQGMTKDEVAAIVAHEIAHICNGDASTMTIAGNLQRAIGIVAAASIASGGRRGVSVSLLSLLHAVPAIAELLCLGLSRMRELAADAFALDLIPNPGALASALEKLEHHHMGGVTGPRFELEGDATAYLRTHPSTVQRLSFVHILA
ncbi:heat shock protein HtpX [Hyphomicrobium sp. 1Nfss2.1]|uniref:M48 family metalloprotease n=1 Tax=Hyphomicrobium sp. 1Nfss2.1 TaxID=3413936 RepID=UPI003C7DD2D8